MPPLKPSFLAFLLCSSALLFSYYAEYQWNMEPCPLCLIQRLLYFLLSISFLGHILFSHRIWLTGSLFWSVLGLLTTGRQVVLQHLPPSKVPACGPGLDYMLSTFSKNDLLQELLHGGGECAVVYGRFLSLSFAEWSLMGFILCLCAACWAFSHTNDSLGLQEPKTLRWFTGFHLTSHRRSRIK